MKWGLANGWILQGGWVSQLCHIINCLINSQILSWTRYIENCLTKLSWNISRDHVWAVLSMWMGKMCKIHLLCSFIRIYLFRWFQVVQVWYTSSNACKTGRATRKFLYLYLKPCQRITLVFVSCPWTASFSFVLFQTVDISFRKTRLALVFWSPINQSKESPLISPLFEA